MKTQNDPTRRDAIGVVGAVPFLKDYFTVNGEGKSQAL